MGKGCVVLNCKDRFNRSTFKVPNDLELRKQWESVIPTRFNKKLSSKSYICEKHFIKENIIRRRQIFDNNGRLIFDAPLNRPRLEPNAIPSIFTTDDVLAHEENANNNFQLETIEISTVVENDPLAPEPIEISSENSEDLTDCMTSYNSPDLIDENEETIDILKSIFRTIQQVLNGNLSNDAVNLNHGLNTNFKFIFENWLFDISEVDEYIIISHIRQLKQQNIRHPVFDKHITIDKHKNINYFINDRIVTSNSGDLKYILSDMNLLTDILKKFENIASCKGIGKVNLQYLNLKNEFMDWFQQWHSENCILICDKRRCSECVKLRNNILQRERRCEKNRIRNGTNLMNQRKFIAMKQQIKQQRLELLKHKKQTEILKQSLSIKSEELVNVSKKTLDGKCLDLNISDSQKSTLHEIVNAASTSTLNGRRYSDNWIMMCILLNIQSPSCYEFLRENDIIPLPCTRTIRRYLSLVDNSCGLDENFAKLLKCKLAK